MDKTNGGFLIPKTSYVDIPRKGRLYSAIRKAGNLIIRLGSSVRALGYRKQEIYPLKSLWEAVRDSRLR